METTTKTIKIAPSMNEVELNGNTVSTDFAGGIKYTAEGLDRYQPEFVIQSFQMAIAMSGKRKGLEWLLNNHFHLEGKVE